MIENLLSTMYDVNFTNTFEWFELTYWLMIILWISLIVVVVKKTEFFKTWKHEKRLRYIAGTLLICGLISEQIWQIHKGWELSASLPLSLCSVSAFFCIYMLFKKSQWAFDVVFFTGILGASWAMIFADIKYDFPHITFINFFLKHILIIVAPIYMIRVHNFKVSMGSYKRMMVSLGTLLPFVLAINLYSGANYFFIMYPVEKMPWPEVLPPFPGRMVVCAAGFLIYSFIGMKIWLAVTKSKNGEIEEYKNETSSVLK